MPAVSKAQARFMRAVASGDIKKKGLSKAKAHEFVAGQKTRNLPEKAGTNGKKKGLSKVKAHDCITKRPSKR